MAGNLFWWRGWSECITKQNSRIPDFMQKMGADDEILESINYLNSKQCNVFNGIYNQRICKHDGVNSKPLHIFLSGSEGTGKSDLVKTIYKFVLKTLLINCKELEKIRVFLLEPTGISAVNIARKTTYSALAIKPAAELLGLGDKLKACLRKKLSEVKLLMINKVSVSLAIVEWYRCQVVWNLFNKY